MGTEIHTIFGHKLTEKEIVELPNGLNALFQEHRRVIRFRRFAFSGDIVKCGDKFSWEPNFYPEEIRGESEPELNRQNPWARREPGMTGVINFSGPFCLDFWFGSRSACLHSDVHWQYLVFDKVF